MLIYVDIDDTICRTSSMDYADATPILTRINRVNKLYDQGHTIMYWTARGTKTGIDWTDITTNQFKRWGVKYHELLFGKPAYDLFIDDKNINSDEYFKEATH